MKILFLITLISTLLHFALSQNDCLPTSCGPTGPTIRFPFRLKDRQPAHCGYPGFELSCTNNGITKFDLRFPITASTNNTNITISLQTAVSVWDIDYMAQKMQASNARSKSCFPEKNNLITTLNSSKFEVEPLGYSDGYTLFNCSSTRDNYYGDQKINCLSGRGYEVIMFASFYDITSLPPYSSCFKMYDISYVPDRMFSVETDDDVYGTRFDLRWREPSCGDTCEENGKYCRLRNGGDGDEEIECFGHEEPQHNTGASRSHKTLTAGIITAGTLILSFITIAPYFILRSLKRNQEDQKTIEKLLANHKGNAMPRRYSYASINKITRNFKNATCGTLHEGTLVDGTRVVVKTIDSSDQNVEDFITGVEIIGRMQHLNVLQLIGYCVDRRKRALVYEFMQNRTLGNLITTLDDKSLHRVALGVAKGINYVRHECDEKILNLDDISPKYILLDDNFDPKIIVFPAAGTYDDVSSKKIDVFSYGKLVLEVLGRRRNLFHGRDNEEEDEIVKKLSIVGLWCTQWFPSDRPSMECVVQMLEGDRMPIMPPNPFHLNTF
ncbi:glycerophosphodiester phosphodiesterase protein kinase domain-containing gdpdl2 [Phtheirospermum japonicum]|uniref:Glycerophosphodiester phosphodiesterase protein kinase domain-containing gdpdl2 n=1 Tax=Phtheirospermum japonicum TaxID=374723 RepID=A0A830BX12_9LAMI|nr:glycerophosphodiester phosphodiesterase protein kinase domain-containing gdpdl2 [Phtheirospermum japonicum]